MKNNILLILIFIFAASSCVIQRSPVSGKKRAYAYSWDQELAIGKEVDAQISQVFGIYDDPALEAYVTKVGKAVLKESHMRREGTDRKFRETPFVFRVLDSPVVNAFALPGGYNYVTRGLLVHLDNEAQLAMVIGHEIAHVAARHASQQALKQQAGSIVLIGTAILGQELLGLPGDQIMGFGGAAAQLVFLRYSRDAERESDRLGVEYSAKAGYKAEEGAKFFTSLRRITEAAGASIPSHLSSHPDPGEREKDIITRSARWAERGVDQTILNQKEFIGAIDGIIYGENPRHGFVENQMFYHPEMRFQFPIPQAWKLVNEPSRVILYHESHNAVGFLAIDSKSESVSASVDEFGNQEGITILDRNTNFNINGLTAASLSAIGKDKNNQEYQFYITALHYNNMIFRFISYSLRSEINSYLPAMNHYSSGFTQLDDQAILNTKPVRLKVITTQRSDRFENFLPAQLPMNITASEIAIVNQVELTDVIPAGAQIKITVAN